MLLRPSSGSYGSGSKSVMSPMKGSGISSKQVASPQADEVMGFDDDEFDNSFDT
jgi:hypothetical protein